MFCLTGIFRFVIFLIYYLTIFLSFSYGDDSNSLNKQVDASLKIIQYVDNWEQIINKDQLFFCISGSDKFAEILANNLVNYKFKYEVKLIVNPAISDIYQCNIYYIKKSYHNIQQLLSKTYERNILTISEDEMVWYNTIISFYFIRNSLRFLLIMMH